MKIPIIISDYIYKDLDKIEKAEKCFNKSIENKSKTCTSIHKSWQLV